MRDFRLLFWLFGLLVTLISGCDSAQGRTSATNQNNVCPKCNMTLPSSNLHTAKMRVDGKEMLFDDIGCLILWAKDKEMDMKGLKIELFTNDTHKYIDASSAFFTVHEKTPMNYGFSTYEKEIPNSIKIDEVWIRMLRGEHMANPKIRKQILSQ